MNGIFLCREGERQWWSTLRRRRVIIEWTVSFSSCLVTPHPSIHLFIRIYQCDFLTVRPGTIDFCCTIEMRFALWHRIARVESSICKDFTYPRPDRDDERKDITMSISWYVSYQLCNTSRFSSSCSDQADYIDEADRFKIQPTEFLSTMFSVQNLQLPSHIVVYDSVDQKILPFLKEHSYRLVSEFFHTVIRKLFMF